MTPGVQNTIIFQIVRQMHERDLDSQDRETRGPEISTSSTSSSDGQCPTHWMHAGVEVMHEAAGERMTEIQISPNLSSVKC